MESVFLLDKSLNEHFRGGKPATILPHEFATIRPMEPRRRIDEVFRVGIPIKMQYDIAMFFIKKYPDRFSFTNAQGVVTQIGDDLDEMLYNDVKDVLLKINKELKNEEKTTYPIAGGKDILIKYIRTYRQLKAEETRQKEEAEAESPGTRAWAKKYPIQNGERVFHTDSPQDQYLLLENKLVVCNTADEEMEPKAITDEEWNSLPSDGWQQA